MTRGSEAGGAIELAPARSDRHHALHSGQRWRSLPALVGVGAFLLSLRMPMGYDEGYWLGIAGLVEHGATLYTEAVDNKPPLIYLLMWLLEHAPGPFVLARAALVSGLLVAWSWLVSRISPSTGRPFLVVLLPALVGLLSTFRLTTELVAASLIAFAWVSARSGKAIGAAAPSLLAAGFDPRSLLVAPALLLALSSYDRWKGRNTSIFMAGATLGAVAVVLFVPQLRFGLVEISLTTRANASPENLLEHLARILLAVLPFATLALTASRSAIRRDVVTMVVGSGAIAIGSVVPIEHYWIYLAIPALRWLPRSFPNALVAVLLGISLVPLILSMESEIRTTRELVQEAQAIMDLIESKELEEEFLFLGGQPYIYAQLPEHNPLAGPNIIYLGYETSKHRGFRHDVEAAVADAEALIVDAEFSTPAQLLPQRYHWLSALYSTATGRFACSIHFSRTLVWLPDRACPATASRSVHL